MSQERIVPVSSLIIRIKTILNQTVSLDGIWIQGEISNLVKHRSGHYYFSLKDESGQLPCVMFSSNVRHLTFNLQEGMKVLLQGSVSVYEARGTLQLYVKTIKQDGIGNLYLELERRKRALYEAGYFNDAHKKERPQWIENIGVITAKEGAALQDVLKTIRIRWPMMKITLYPAFVQGNNAPSSMVRSLLKADSNGHDALLLVRGGGSFEDLFCFNDVELVKTIYSLNTYIVTGVGHEVDTTLVDYVSDHRCVTPTAAAQWISQDQREIRGQLHVYQSSMVSSLKSLMDTSRIQLNHYLQNPYFQDPHSFLYDKELKLDHYISELEHYTAQIENKQNSLKSIQQQLSSGIKNQYRMKKNELDQIDIDSLYINYIRLQKEKMYKKISLLDAYSPLKTLDRGYSIVLKDKKVIKSVEQIHENDSVVIQFFDGKCNATILDKESNNG